MGSRRVASRALLLLLLPLPFRRVEVEVAILVVDGRRGGLETRLKPCCCCL
jgi:hypothetical protein